MPTSDAQKAANRKYLDKVKNTEEYKLKRREQMRAWRQKNKFEIAEKRRQKSAEQRERAKAELLSPPLESYSCYDSEPSTAAARINQQCNFTIVIGEYHSGTSNKHCILEQLRSDFGKPVFRLKVTEYYQFHSAEDAERWSKEHRMQLSSSRYR